MPGLQPAQLAVCPVGARQAGKINLATPFNFASTADIIGGNSGSPVVNKAAEVVGIIFDGNMQSLPWRYVYDDAIGRAVSVDSRGIVEALRSIYGANRVIQELQSGHSTAAAAAASTANHSADRITH